MAYRVDRFNGTFLVNVEDGTINNTTDLRFIGKNYPGYGEVVNENFLHLLENFSNSTPPPKPISGQIWFNSNTKRLMFYDGTSFKTGSGPHVSKTPPDNMSTGDLWFDSVTEQVKVWNGTKFLVVGPDNASNLIAASITPYIVKDTSNVSHTILKFDIKDETVGVVSKTEFNLNPALTPIDGFSRIKKGFTLSNVDDITGISLDNFYYWGTASNSILFNGRPESDFTLKSESSYFGDSGITIGDQNDLRIYVENGNVPVFENQLGRENTNAQLVFRINTGTQVENQLDVSIIDATAVFPGTTDTYTLGKSSSKWKSVHASMYYGDLTGNVTGNIIGRHTGNMYDNAGNLRFDAALGKFYGDFEGGTFKGTFIGQMTGTASDAKLLNGFSSSVEDVPLTIPVRDKDSVIYAKQFTGNSESSNKLLVDDRAAASTSRYKTAKTISEPDTIVARNNAGDVFAVVFNGTATAARYADLAEKYITDKEYEVGTVVEVGGDEEVTASTANKRPIGVVSQSPAFMMNSEQTNGTYIGIKGRLPIRVIGPVKKGCSLVPSDIPGVAKMGNHADTFVFAFSREDSNNEDVRLVDATVI